MTRIFDALRKSRTHAPPPAAATPPPPAPITPARPQPPFAAPVALAQPALVARPALAPPPLERLTTPPVMGDEVLREMGTLRVHLESALNARMPRTVMLVSAQGGEGTTTIAMQLAVALSRDAAIRVLLVDAHARRPVLSARSGDTARAAKPGSEPGAALGQNLRVLVLQDILRSTGGITAQTLRLLLESVEASFDWIIVDGPPVLESPDSASIAVAVDGVVMVVQAGRTKRPVLTRSVDLLRKAGARVLGTVLNRRRLEIPGFIYRRI